MEANSHPASLWTVAPASAIAALHTDEELGLSSIEASMRLEKYGRNVLVAKDSVRAFAIFLRQFQSLLIWVLLGAAALSGALREWMDAAAILFIILLNAALGFIQEFRAEKSLAALKRLSTSTARVIRGGSGEKIPSTHLVPGDVVEVDAGDAIAADGRLLWTAAFLAQEASLTGESTPVLKESERTLAPDTGLADRINMVYMGTSAVAGRARFVVSATGMATEMGRIAALLQNPRREVTPLQKRLEDLGRWLVYLCLAVATVIFLLGLLRGVSVIEMFLTAISLAVAAIPEGLPAVVTLALAIGVQRMVRRQALIRKLPAVETLGCANVICTDKTGTLTQNEMTVRKIWTAEAQYDVSGVGYSPQGSVTRIGLSAGEGASNNALTLALQAGALCNSASLNETSDHWQVLGDPTEGALLTLAAKAGVNVERLSEEMPRVAEIPFDSERKRMSVICQRGARWRTYVKGAPDIVLSCCKSLESRGGPEPIQESTRREIALANAGLAKEGLRVLAMAYRDFDEQPPSVTPDVVEKDLVLAALVAMQDPPRPEAAQAVRRCQEAGIRCVMITGDHPETARAVAAEVGLFKAGDRVISGTELEQMSQEDLARQVADVAVYARVSAEHKLRVVQAWQSRSAVVAMTGDGVNDAPALRAADIGVAMGVTGTDVSKEAADMVVLDDNFASIVAAVEEGRGIYENIRKFVFYLLSCNTAEILVMFLSSLAGWPLPLLPVQILWLNLVTDGFPALALGVEAPPPDVMRRPVRRREENIVDRPFAVDMVGAGLLIAACSLCAFGVVYFAEGAGIRHARTIGFYVLALAQLSHAFNCRSERFSVAQIGIFSNPWLVLAVIGSIGLQGLILEWPITRRLFDIELPTLSEWVLIAVLAVIPLLAGELIKTWRRRRGHFS